MIVILCNSFEDAQDAYEDFIAFLELYEPLAIKKRFDPAYCVETDDDLRYIFVDYRFEKLFLNFDTPDYVDAEEFFEGIDEYYFGFWR